jgi:hypothetical protein
MASLPPGLGGGAAPEGALGAALAAGGLLVGLWWAAALRAGISPPRARRPLLWGSLGLAAFGLAVWRA